MITQFNLQPPYFLLLHCLNLLNIAIKNSSALNQITLKQFFIFFLNRNAACDN